MTIRPLVTAALLMATHALTGCGGAASLPPADELLIPQIAQDGTKFFTYQLRYLRPEPDPTDQLINRQAAPVANPRSRQESFQLRGPEVEYRLDAVFALTGYCREGYFELYRDATREGFSLRGECREDATEGDRRRFTGDPIPLRRSGF